MNTYKTKITTKQEKRNQLKSRLDNFSTFKWRGESAFDKFGMFIIADKAGDLKFYNGPSFSNEYSKTQFSNSSGELLGVTFNRQQVSFKVGMYYFTINEWQDFLEWVNAYEVNYLTFDYAPKYGYLVKLAKMEDSSRYIVGYSGSEPAYYTEMTLIWDLQGDSCIRANLPYEWKYESGSFILNKDSKDIGSTISRLETPLLLTIPLSIDEKEVTIEFKNKTDTLFKVALQKHAFNSKIQWVPIVLQEKWYSNTTGSTSISGVFMYDSNIYNKLSIHWIEDKDDNRFVELIFDDDENTKINRDQKFYVQSDQFSSDLFKYFTSAQKQLTNVDDFYKQNVFLIQPTIQYDSETGVLLYNVGDTSWKLLHLNMTDDEGNYMIKNMQVNKFKLQGNVDNYNFTLSITGASISNNTQPMLQVYERTNVI